VLLLGRVVRQYYRPLRHGLSVPIRAVRDYYVVGLCRGFALCRPFVFVYVVLFVIVVCFEFRCCLYHVYLVHRSLRFFHCTPHLVFFCTFHIVFFCIARFIFFCTFHLVFHCILNLVLDGTASPTLDLIFYFIFRCIVHVFHLAVYYVFVFHYFFDVFWNIVSLFY